MPKLFLFARDPGGANALLAMIPILLERGYELSIAGKDVAVKLFENAGFATLPITQVVPDISAETILAFLQTEKPDFLLTGTSSDDFTERYFWQAAETLQIPSLAIFDFWGNYGLRFSPYLAWDLDLYNLNKTHLALPTKICMMDEFARRGMIEDGIPDDHIAVTGQPYFKKLLDRKKAILSSKQHHLKQQIFGETHAFAVTFGSQSLTETYQVSERGDCHWGYTEQSILQESVEALKEVAERTNQKIILLIKPHPKNELPYFQTLIQNFSHPLLEIRLSTEDSVWDVIEASDLIISMFSMMLIEAVILGKPILSVQIGLRQDDPFILTQRGLTQSVLSPTELVVRLQEILLEPKNALVDFELVDGAVESIVGIMEHCLCPSVLLK